MEDGSPTDADCRGNTPAIVGATIVGGIGGVDVLHSVLPLQLVSIKIPVDSGEEFVGLVDPTRDNPAFVAVEADPVVSRTLEIGILNDGLPLAAR